MLTIGICEDESWFADDLKRRVKEYLEKRGLVGLVRTFVRGEELLRNFEDLDIVLMDIKLPGRDGMEIAGRMRDLGGKSQIVFVTSYQDYVFQAFDMDAVHYLLKPVDGKKLEKALDKAVGRVVQEQGKTLLAEKEGVTVRIGFREITYGEVFDHQVFLHTMSENYKVSGTLDSLEKRLDGRFFRCHRSYLVNMEHVAHKGEDYAVMRGGGRVLISRRRQREFTRRLLEVLRGEGG